MSASKTPLVVDNGSDTIKAGFAKEEAPCSVFFTVVGQTVEAKGQEILDRPIPCIGDEAKAKKGVIDLTYPIKNSIITDFDGMEEVRRTFRNKSWWVASIPAKYTTRLVTYFLEIQWDNVLTEIKGEPFA